ncbi:hypothetical protein QM480_03315 [Flectobacillus sp. DC10W]|jgi:predicted nucleic acid-binding protein|uniref:PIN domain-containing protein n=1 Tax=Flectobacillus longus TaxID=2984207 RepID=A0ABT6YIC7_9BACT|nr:hypothetical protein [Flectobacillus longus]MDI9863339.1 hypothetical protein [Flectobacillus longus]
MRIVINDANILIDLIHLKLIHLLFELKHLELKTTDFVFEELEVHQRAILQIFIDQGTLEIIESDEMDLERIYNLLIQTSGLSFEDCSVWYFAKINDGILLTGDGKLRKQSTQDGVEVRGILFVFDELLRTGLINFTYALLKLNQLYQINNRLPLKAKNERIELWSREERIVY